MSHSTTTVQPSHPTPLDDELTALMLQLEELGLFSQTRKGKHAIDRPPDHEVAFANFQAELQGYKTTLNDHKLAQSIGAAVHSDGVLISDLTDQEVKSCADRRMALEMSNNDPEIETPPRSTHVDIQDDMETISRSIAAASVIEFSDDETEAGPSMTYTERQAETMRKLSMEFQCCACTDRYSRAFMITATCSHRYCLDCIKDLFMRSTKDEGLYPPKCCRQHISVATVSKHMDPDQLAAFELATVEYATRNRTYCNNYACSMFIVPGNIEPGTERATCSKCGTHTCATCKNGYHYNTDCPDDPSLLQTRELARGMGWQTCYACDRVVQLRSGCNHMTCLCKAEFCYVCGARWKECNCQAADPNRIEERAEEIVERDAPLNLPPAERRRQVRQVFAELQENHECEHSRRFQRITFGAPRGGFRCELCDARHYKYILQCRHCYVNVCEDCRRNRI
ncbi:hypothetical protein K505DRAFT_258151 [Melanomma pulvis-pyrius CBS 109.77]|uniref:RBR-type E3 ubiquitin transferase n=1 Tax=Melanomma pulvis-pyrius CBS 109.77 TaxID=1314802 RepID=A0A6A6WU08_9PLEO|nr:hypothetical protein K505DRAFT_258151 [Melanomma pulvis-pyrius CBS 109.77]